MPKSNDKIRNSWASLGIAFNTDGLKNKNPEETIIEFLKSGEFPKDRKIYSLMLLWLKEYSKYIHVENLKNRMKELTLLETAILGSIAIKCVNHKDIRWNAIIREAKKTIDKENIIFKEIDRKAFIKFKGSDDDFMKFNLSIAKTDPADPKKLMKKEYILKNNEWLKNRFVFGTNLRADFITVFKLNLVSNAYQAAKLLRCSIKASYRNWNDLKEAASLGFI